MELNDIIGHKINTVTRVPIGDIVVDPNIRKVVGKISPSFIQSVKQHGVLVPVDAYQVDGVWHLQDGQLRYLASVDAGKEDLPVLVADPAEAEIARYERQLILNEHRNELTDSDRAGAYQTLFELGVSADAIARHTQLPKKKIEKALAVTSSGSGNYALESGIGLDQAAVIVEFEDDPQTVERLTSIARDNPDQFAYSVEEQRRKLVDAAEKAEAAAPVVAAGIPVEEPGTAFTNATELVRIWQDKTEKKRVTIEMATGHGLIALMRPSYAWVDGKRIKWAPQYYVVDAEAQGWFIHKSDRPPLTDEQRAERKETRDNNQAWPIATTVRQAWIVDELLARKTLPSNVDQFITISLAGGHPRDGHTSGTRKAMEWLGLKDSQNYDHDEIVLEAEAKPGNAQRIALTLAIANAEDKIASKEGWRVHYGDRTKLGRYLTALAGWGYGLSSVEATLTKPAAKK